MCFVGVVVNGPDDVIYFPGQGLIELSCNVSSGSTVWLVNGTTYLLAQLQMGMPANHSRNGTSIVIEVPVNATEYVCASLINDDLIKSTPAFIYIAGECILLYLRICHIF